MLKAILSLSTDVDFVKSAFDYVDENVDKFVEDLKGLCAQPSISAQGVGIDECARLVKEMLEEAGLLVELRKEHGGNPIVLGELMNPRARKTLLFYNHYDVQPPDPLDGWLHPPFEPKVQDGKLYARGAADNKGNIIARLKAVETLLKTIGEVPVNVKFVIEGEEEVGSLTLPDFVKTNKERLRADLCIWETGYIDEKGRPNVYLGAKGILYVELTVKDPSSDLHSSYGVIVDNPAWRLVKALGSLRAPDGKVLIEGFYEHVEKLSEDDLALLEMIELDEESLKRRLGIRSLLGGLTGLEAKAAYYLGPAVNICGLVAGYIGPGSKTILPSKASAKLDFRLVLKQSPDDILSKLRRHLDKLGFSDVEIVYLNGYPAGRTPIAHPFVKLVTETAAEVYGAETVVCPSIAGSGPVYLFTEALGIPTISTGCNYYDSKVHAPNENIRVKDFITGIKHIALLLSKFASSYG